MRARQPRQASRSDLPEWWCCCWPPAALHLWAGAKSKEVVLRHSLPHGAVRNMRRPCVLWPRTVPLAAVLGEVAVGTALSEA